MRFLVIFLLIVTLYADKHELHSKHHINKELSHLELTHEQRRQVKTILKHFRKDLKVYKELEEEIEQKRKEIFLSDTIDTDKLDRLNDELDKKAHEIENAFLKSMHTILTKEQREKFVDYFDDWKVE